jgi:dihydrofolate reductase
MLMMNVSLDGYVARPDHDLSWLFGDLDQQAGERTFQTLAATDTQLIGRVNYQEQAAYWPSSTQKLAPLINSARKIVFSRTLDRVDWSNSRLATADPATEIARLKQQDGRDIFVPGGASFAQSLSRLGLIDEYKLIVHPIALGAGLPLFADEIDLKLVDSRPFPSGAIALSYVAGTPAAAGP